MDPAPGLQQQGQQPQDQEHDEGGPEHGALTSAAAPVAATGRLNSDAAGASFVHDGPEGWPSG